MPLTLERTLREIRRRTRVVGALPAGQLALNLAAAYQMVDEAILEHGVAKGSADERHHHRLSQCWVPLA